MSTQYNGWTNRETWLVKLWIDNEQGTYEYWHQQAENAVLDGNSVGKLADMLRGEHTELAWQKLETGAFADLLQTALARVNWDEIAESMITDAKQTVETAP